MVAWQASISAVWLFRATLFEANGPRDLFRVLNKEEIDPSDNWNKTCVFVALLQVNENSVEGITLSLY